jgi:TRAP transporter TAXI family solute receptor
MRLLSPGLGGIAAAAAQDVRYFRIGGGQVGSRLYQLAGALAGAITNPPGGDNCDRSAPCGVPGVVGLAQTTSGSVENLQALRDRTVESALVQADLAAAAFAGTDAFKAAGPFGELRALARLGTASIQIVVPADSPAKAIADLKGRSIGVGPKGGDAAAIASALLAANGITAKRARLVAGDLPGACADLAAGKLDAVILVDGFPNPDVTTLAQTGSVRLLPADAATTDKLRKARPYLTVGAVPANTYRGQAAAVPTIDLPILWTISAGLEDHLAYLLVKAVGGVAAPDSSGGPIALALAGTTAPLRLHPGAQAYFQELSAAGATSTN